MANFNINIDGGFFVVTNDPFTQEYIRKTRSDTIFDYTKSSGRFRFFWNTYAPQQSSKLSILGNPESEFLYSELQTVTETIDGVPTVIPIADVDALVAYLSSKISVSQGEQFVTLGNQIVPKENTGVGQMLAQITPAATNTPELLYSPNLGEEVHITNISIASASQQDVDLIFYFDNVGTTWDATTRVANPTVSNNSSEPSLFNNAVTYMNNENGSFGVESNRINVVISVWGIIYV